MVNVAAWSDSFSNYVGAGSCQRLTGRNAAQSALNQIQGASINNTYNVKDPFFGTKVITQPMIRQQFKRP